MKSLFFLGMLFLCLTTHAQTGNLSEYNVKIINAMTGQNSIRLGYFKGVPVPSLCDGPNLFCFEEVNVSFRDFRDGLTDNEKEALVNLQFSNSTFLWNDLDRDLWFLIEDQNGVDWKFTLLPCSAVDASTEMSDLAKLKTKRLNSRDSINIGEIEEVGYCLESTESELRFYN
ncbi:hypothetical protein GW916_13730 [bacterium]|nr:hypothetical protein [bacterium]